MYDVNHLQLGDTAEPELAFGFLEAELGDRPYRRVMTDPFSAPACVATLAQQDYRADPTLQGLLSGPLLGPPPAPWEIRPVLDDEAWQALFALIRANHVEVDRTTGRSIFSPAVSGEIQQVRRSVAREVHFFLVWIEGEAVAYFSSWPGIDGVGVVEDLFTLPAHRGRGIARALIHHCVAEARARGAESVLIGSDPADSPKQLYASMGFEPTCLTWGWTKAIPG